MHVIGQSTILVNQTQSYYLLFYYSPDYLNGYEFETQAYEITLERLELRCDLYTDTREACECGEDKSWNKESEKCERSEDSIKFIVGMSVGGCVLLVAFISVAVFCAKKTDNKRVAKEIQLS